LGGFEFVLTKVAIDSPFLIGLLPSSFLTYVAF